MTRETYYVNAEHTGRAVRAHYGSQLTDEQKRSEDYVRVTITEARRMRKQCTDQRAGGAGDHWANLAGRAVGNLAGCSDWGRIGSN